MLPRLFVLCAVLTKQEGGKISIGNNLAYRFASDGEDAVVGRYVQYLMENNAGFALSGKVSVMEITREDLMHMEAE